MIRKILIFFLLITILLRPAIEVFLNLDKIQKYILSYHSGKFIQFGTVWDLLLFNKWHTWWGENLIIRDPNWNIFWPISTLLFIVNSTLAIFKKIKLNKYEVILILWLWLYLLMLSTGSVSVRYFVPLIPFLYILFFAFLYKIKLIKNFFKNL